MTIKCPKCGIELELPDDAVGAKVKCSECGEKFIAPVQQRSIDAECPYCHTVYEVTQEELGTNVQCEQCNKMFIVREKPFQKEQLKEGGNLKVCEISIPELSERAMQIRERSKGVSKEKEAVALRDELIEIKNEIVRRYEIAKNRAIETSRQNVPFLLKPFSFVFVNFRTMPEDEIYLQKLSSKMALVAREIMMHTNAVVQQDRVRQKRIAEEERKRVEEERKNKEEAERKAKISISMEDITKCVQTIYENKRPDPICYDYFSYLADEVVYFVQKDVPCIVPHQKKSETYGGGTFVITNKRIVYTTERHIQTYRMNSIRDFAPCWRLDSGWITIATSDKRMERYKLDAAWRPTLLTLFFANDVFREMLLTQDISATVDNIWSRIKTTPSPLHFKLLGTQFENFGIVTICGVSFYDGSDQYKSKEEYRKVYDKFENVSLEKLRNGTITSDAYDSITAYVICPDRLITAADKLSGKWDDIEALCAGAVGRGRDSDRLEVGLRLAFASM